MIRVLLIDDHAIVREGFKRLIESSPGFLVVAEARNADEALSALERVSADIAVVDISAESPAARIVFFMSLSLGGCPAAS